MSADADEGFEVTLENMLVETGRPMHPSLEPYVPRGEIDPTAVARKRDDGTEITLRERTIHSLCSQHAIEPLTATLTPLGMVVIVEALLGFLSPTDDELEMGYHGIDVDPWGEIRQLAPDVREEFGRAAWHFSWAWEGILKGRPVEELRAEELAASKQSGG